MATVAQKSDFRRDEFRLRLELLEETERDGICSRARIKLESNGLSMALKVDFCSRVFISWTTICRTDRDAFND